MLLAVEAAILVVALRPRAGRHRADDQAACVREREEASALAQQVQGLQARLHDTNARLAARVLDTPVPEAAVPPPPVIEAPSSAPETATAAARRPPADAPLVGIAEVQARDTADPGWTTGAEARLRTLARSFGPAATVDDIRCTGTLCRVELAHGEGALPAGAVDAFIAGATDLMPQVMIHPHVGAGKTTLVFARAGNTLPAAEGGGDEPSVSADYAPAG